MNEYDHKKIEKKWPASAKASAGKQAYNHRIIERKWQHVWDKQKLYATPKNPRKGKKQYVLDMFPYPSGAGLHVGHPEGYTATDIYSRYLRMNGYDALHPMGWDAFGLPAENYAIQKGVHPAKTTAANIKRFREQIKSLGLSYDWAREVDTSDPDYYKWTQWLFLKLYEKGLAYRKEANVNWCPKDQTVLANEQVINGRCHRCDSEVVQKLLPQWFFKITDYADRLLEGLGKIDWPQPIKLMQRNWIGKSEGAEIGFEIVIPAKAGIQSPIAVEDKSGSPTRSGMTKPNYVFLHAFRGSPNDDFWPWLKKEIEKRGGKVFAPQLPNPSAPIIEEQVKFLLKNYKFDSSTVIVTHSLGGVLAMKLLPRLNVKIKYLVMAAPPLRTKFLDNKSRPALNKCCDWKFDFESIQKKVESINVVKDVGDNIVPSDQPEEIAKNLSARLIEVKATDPHFHSVEEPELLKVLAPSIKIFTTRPDTIFGATYMVLAPENPLIQNIEYRIENRGEVKEYIEKAKKKTELQRTALEKEKTGVELKGIKAINPATKEEIPIWIADYVLMGYGTGAIMAVPAHDERDFAFAKKYNLSIKQVIAPHVIDMINPPKEGKKNTKRIMVHAIVRHPKENKIISLKWKSQPWQTFVTGGVEEGEDVIKAAEREVREETGYKNLRFVGKLPYTIFAEFFAAHKDVNRAVWANFVMFELVNLEQDEVTEEEKAKHEVVWIDVGEVRKLTPVAEIKYVVVWLERGDTAYTGDGIVLNSDKFNGMDSESAKWEITKFVGGQPKTQYKLRDWLISRQRYWGAPIPIVYCQDCGMQAIPEKDLPVKLPTDVDFRPTGESPLARSKSFNKVKCPNCKKSARRETDTMDTFVDSSWYWLRYTDPKNDKKPFDKLRAHRWCPVDTYVGGAEHAVLHLMYARFFCKALKDMGYVNFNEPFLKLRNQGLILGPDGQKMSKSKGNVINPDDVVAEFGADTMRMYEMFMGPLEQVKPWSMKGVEGVYRFLGRVWRLVME
ncbi:MAG: class I tRNA ligase family protein, partial [Candidatus Doudnabacteria bacterium]|nr:class I tRNA ligase family protein [Candidatus Doudnabacteria bacterium]